MSSHTGAEKKQRLFFALWPDDDIRIQLWRSAREHIPPEARPVAIDGLHATLLFIGSADAARRACLESVADGLIANSFTLVFDKIGYWRKSRILWLGCADPPGPLFELVNVLRAGAGACGVNAETRPYHAHITLARKLSHGPETAQAIAPVEWRVSRFALVQSITGSAGASYQTLRFWGLGEK